MGHVCLHVVLWVCGLMQDPTASPREAETDLFRRLQAAPVTEGIFSSTLSRTNTYDPTRAPIQFPATAVRESTGVVSAKALQHKVPKKAKQAYDRGLKLAKKGKDLEASREFELASQIDPGYAPAHNNLGVEYFRLQRYPQAESEYRRALELDPSFVLARVNLATYAWFQGDLSRAETEVRRALTLAPNDAQARALLDAVLTAARR